MVAMHSNSLNSKREYRTARKKFISPGMHNVINILILGLINTVNFLEIHQTTKTHSFYFIHIYKGGGQDAGVSM